MKIKWPKFEVEFVGCDGKKHKQVHESANEKVFTEWVSSWNVEILSIERVG